MLLNFTCLHGLMQNSTYLQNVFIRFLYLSARTLTAICPCLDAVVNDCWWLYLSLHERHNDKSLCHFYTNCKTHLFWCIFTLAHSPHCCAQNASIAYKLYFSKYRHSFFTVKNENKMFISKKIGNIILSRCTMYTKTQNNRQKRLKQTNTTNHQR